MAAIKNEIQRFRIRTGAGAVGILSFSFAGIRCLEGETPKDSAFFAALPDDFLARQWGWETLPDMGAELAYTVAQSLGGGTVEDLRSPALIKRARKACELPPGAIS